MGKFENVPELRGTENYHEWRRRTEPILLGEGVYNHISRGTNPFDYLEYASVMPQPEVLMAPTSQEREQIRAWLKSDGLARAIIMRKISASVLALIPDDINLTARDTWTILADYFGHADVSFQFSIKAKLADMQMKGAADAEKYVTAHIHVHERLSRMGVKPTDMDAINALLHGLPSDGVWPMIRKTIEGKLEESDGKRGLGTHHMQPRFQHLTTLGSPSSEPFLLSPPHFQNAPLATPDAHAPAGNPSDAARSSRNPFFLQHSNMQSSSFPVPYTFRDAAQMIIEEATRMLHEPPTTGPGSEYASDAAGPGSVNPATGLRRTRNNPTGTACTNSICVGKGTCLGHDNNNCFQEGGARFGQAPWQRKKKINTSTDTQQPTAAETAAAVATISAGPAGSSFGMNLTCVALSDLRSIPFATILDSSTTSHVIKDASLFWSFNPRGGVEMQTVDRGTLSTQGSGDCVAFLSLGSGKIRLRLKDCLLAPEACLNVLSIGRMVEAGWGVEFSGGKQPVCKLSHNGVALGSLPMVGHLCPISLEFLHPSHPVSGTLSQSLVGVTPKERV